MDILKIISDNKLVYLTFDELAKELSLITLKDRTTTKLMIKELLESGDLLLDGNQHIYIPASRGYIKCIVRGNQKGFAFAERIENSDLPDIFVPRHATMNAVNGDIVWVNVTQVIDNYNPEGEIVNIVKRNTEYVVGTLQVSKNGIIVDTDDDKFPSIKIFKPDLMGANNGDKVVAKVVFDDLNQTMHGVITEVLGKAGTVSAEQLSIIRSYKVKDKFEEKTLKEASKIKQNVTPKDLEGREDFTHLNTITIDGEDSRDFDDAISVERIEKGGYRLGVHIADVSHYVKEGSALDDEAFIRGTSVYFSDLVIPMLPEQLSNGICSLREGVQRLTLSVIIDLDKDCNVLNSRISEGIIISKHRMTYTKVQKMIEGDIEIIEQYKDIAEDINAYVDISHKLKQKRYERGEIRFDIPEPQIFENEDGSIAKIEKLPIDESHQLIESLMILCNEVVAKTFFSKKYPFVYRVHEKPEVERVETLIEMLKALHINTSINTKDIKPYDFQKILDGLDDDGRKDTINKIILRTMMKARYAPECLGHFGIASTFYCHFTSPIRRYPDLMIHRIIKASLRGQKAKESRIHFEDIVPKACEQSSLTEKRADEVEREVMDYKKALYMNQYLGEVYDGVVSGVQEFGIFVELPNTIEGMVKFENLPIDNYDYDPKTMQLNGSKHQYTLGTKVQVMVVAANTHTRRIEFELADRVKPSSLEEIAKQKDKSNKERMQRSKKSTPTPKQTKHFNPKDHYKKKSKWRKDREYDYNY
ncbi:MAG: ribonuclease R [Clostridia bacterium]|nr:ribonuclease R [Clostridia bacterium]